MPIDYADFDVLTFDTYGTLIDWETGLLAALPWPLPASRRRRRAARALRAARGRRRGGRVPALPRGARAGAARRGRGHRRRGRRRRGRGVRGERARLAGLPGRARGARAAQAALQLAVITNCDTDLFAASNAGSASSSTGSSRPRWREGYKPGPRPFELAFATIDAPRERILHVAQSLYHDHVTARELGLTSVWIDRRAGRAGRGDAARRGRAGRDVPRPRLVRRRGGAARC